VSNVLEDFFALADVRQVNKYLSVKTSGTHQGFVDTSARLVAAKTITFELVPNPSISVKSWFKVFSRSSFPPRNCSCHGHDLRHQFIDEDNGR
jgi:hypothetical protein